MELNLKPVKVDIQIETPSLESNSFHNLCFITENDVAPRTLEVRTLSDLLENGYTRLDLAYNFCVGVFAQQSMPSVLIRAKRATESYEEAFDAGDNSGYYYVVIESKQLSVIYEFNSYLSTKKELKLLFYSNKDIDSNTEKITLASYYQKYEVLAGGVTPLADDYYLNKAYAGIEGGSDNGFLNVDLTGASGFYLTLSRNETDFTTFNLADPSFDAVAFQNFIALGQNGASGAFFKYPDILPDELIFPSDQSGIAGMTVAGNVITPRHGAAGYAFEGDSLAFGSLIVNKPFEITPEYNTLTAKATPDVPAGQDIFYSLDGAIEGGTVTIVSHAVIQFASPIACTPTSFPFNVGDRAPTLSQANVHGRYRVNNGAWVDFVDTTQEQNDLTIVRIFMESIRQQKTLTSKTGETVTALFGLVSTNEDIYAYDTVNDEYLGGGFPSSFMFSAFRNFIGYTVDANLEYAILAGEAQTNTIEFVTSTRTNSVDIVQAMFGGNYTAVSCAIARRDFGV